MVDMGDKSDKDDTNKMANTGVDQSLMLVIPSDTFSINGGKSLKKWVTGLKLTLYLVDLVKLLRVLFLNSRKPSISCTAFARKNSRILCNG